MHKWTLCGLTRRGVRPSASMPEKKGPMPSAEIVSTEPATGAELWRGMPGDVDAEVARARASWADWASRSLAFRVEAARRFANVVRRQQDAFADLIAREDRQSPRLTSSP